MSFPSSIQIFNMDQWPGKQLDKTAKNSKYICQSSSNKIGPPAVSDTLIAVDCKLAKIPADNSPLFVWNFQIRRKIWRWPKRSLTCRSIVIRKMWIARVTVILLWRTCGRTCEASTYPPPVRYRWSLLPEPMMGPTIARLPISMERLRLRRI